MVFVNDAAYLFNKGSTQDKYFFQKACFCRNYVSNQPQEYLLILTIQWFKCT